jgi:hypothetical protein
LIITPDGLKEGVEPTEKIVTNKPYLKNWVIKKFRQPVNHINLKFNGIAYPLSDIQVLHKILPAQGKLDINVFITNMDQDEKKYQQLAFLYLDHILGEFNVITKIRYIDFHHLDEDKSIKGAISLLDLRKLIEQEL